MPSARTRAIVGVNSGDTAAARIPSATNKTMFCCWADAETQNNAAHAALIARSNKCMCHSPERQLVVCQCQAAHTLPHPKCVVEMLLSLTRDLERASPDALRSAFPKPP